VLKDRRACHNRLPSEPRQHQLGIAYAEFRFACEYTGNGRKLCAPFKNDYLDALGGIVTFGLRRIVSGELKLITPFQQEVHALGRIRSKAAVEHAESIENGAASTATQEGCAFFILAQVLPPAGMLNCLFCIRIRVQLGRLRSAPP